MSTSMAQTPYDFIILLRLVILWPLRIEHKTPEQGVARLNGH